MRLQTPPLILRCAAKRSLERGFRGSRGWLEPSFEARSRGHPRLKGEVGHMSVY